MTVLIQCPECFSHYHPAFWERHVEEQHLTWLPHLFPQRAIQKVVDLDRRRRALER